MFFYRCLFQAHFEKFKVLYDGYKFHRREDKFMFLGYETQNPKNRKHAPFILEQIVNWLYTGELKILHKVELDKFGNELVDKSEFLNEMLHFAEKFGSFKLKKTLNWLGENINADLKQMNDDRRMNGKIDKTQTRQTFDNLSFNERICFILGKRDENHPDILGRFIANERSAGREFDMDYFRNNK